MQSYQKDFTPQLPPSRQSTLFNILNTNLRANGQRGTPTHHKINVCSPHNYRFTNLPRRGTSFTTAWYIVYQGLVHRLPRPGTSFTKAWYIVYHAVVTNLVNRSLLHTAIFHIFRRLSQHPPKR